VLLTGAGGFIGRHALEELLSRGYEVDAVGRRGGEPREGVRWHQVDLLSEGAAGLLARAVEADRLLHLAWYATPAKFWSAPENEQWVGATDELLREFAAAGGRRVTVAGTCAEYAWGDELLIEDETPLEPATFYGACKRDAFLASSALAVEQGFSLGWGRIFFLYGPGEPPGRLVSDVASALIARARVPTTAGLQRRDFMNVRDAACGLVALLDSDVTGAVNIATGRPVAVREIVGLIESEAASGSVGYGELPDRPGEPDVIAAATERLTAQVGFRQSVGLREGIAETVAWHRAAAAEAAVPVRDRG
jgi:nucleoside-diphosphate-sugar epimerase